MIKVYIACPYTIGDQAENVRNAMTVASALMSIGLVPFNPLLSHFHQIMFPQPFEIWMEQDFEWVSVCDCVLRLPGESRGADMEERHADVLGKPVFHSIEDLLYHYKL